MGDFLTRLLNCDIFAQSQLTELLGSVNPKPQEQFNKENFTMSIAQVVYRISTDNDFANQWHLDPEGTLAKRGLWLSNEELAFLKAGLKRNGQVDQEVSLADILRKATNWR